mmetsp:Transcript_11301/g.32064  ORF Transcript_11301/g.32064 Transcript_11301/m.32064 type:complete len:221 (-) Transcript_11301:1561-2223(-)
MPRTLPVAWSSGILIALRPGQSAKSWRRPSSLVCHDRLRQKATRSSASGGREPDCRSDLLTMIGCPSSICPSMAIAASRPSWLSNSMYASPRGFPVMWSRGMRTSFRPGQLAKNLVTATALMNFGSWLTKATYSCPGGGPLLMGRSTVVTLVRLAGGVSTSALSSLPAVAFLKFGSLDWRMRLISSAESALAGEMSSSSGSSFMRALKKSSALPISLKLA